MSNVGIREKAIKDRANYQQWAKAGWIVLTPGCVTDYDFIVTDIVKDSKVFEITEMVGDPWRSRSIQNSLEKLGFEKIIEFSQSVQAIRPGQ